MALSISAVMLLAVVLVVMIRGGSIKAGPATIAVLFGFFLAGTGANGTIRDTLASLSQTISQL
ncbi:hypothetical protein [Streptomyces violascens]|uniref:hypothetical protein n=1 Tax=Streptomyces violascens TaxID=67381 RepID=UPI003692C334